MEDQKKPPIVSVIVPNYNHGKFLKERLDSILAQTFTDYEVILLDDRSTDGSDQLLLSYSGQPHISAVILNETNTGSPFVQWEKGIKTARGKYIWIAESDDSARKEFLQTTVALMEKHPDCSLCFSGSHFIDSEGNDVDGLYRYDHWKENGKAYIYNGYDFLKHRMLRNNSVYNASMVLFRKERCLSDISNAYRKMKYCGDWYFWIEQIRKGNVIEVQKKLNYFRKHGSNTTEEGFDDCRSIKEITIVKNHLHNNVIRDRVAVLDDRYRIYRGIRKYKLSSETRRLELFRIIKDECGIGYSDYLMGKVFMPLWRVFIRPLSLKKHRLSGQQA